MELKSGSLAWQKLLPDRVCSHLGQLSLQMLPKGFYSGQTMKTWLYQGNIMCADTVSSASRVWIVTVKQLDSLDGSKKKSLGSLCQLLQHRLNIDINLIA